MRSDMKRHIFTHSRDRPHPRSLRALTVQLGGDNEEVVLLDSDRLCVQVRISGEHGMYRRKGAGTVTKSL